MDEKGGAKDEPSKKGLASNYINYKIVLTAIMTVLIGAAVIMSMIFYGMKLSQKYEEDKRLANQPAPAVEKVIEVEYEEESFAYSTDHVYSETEHSQSLVLENLDVKQPYLIVNTPEKLDEVLDAIARVRGENRPEYKVDEGFFVSSSIIVTAVQDRGFERANITGVHRDASYNISITIEKMSPFDTQTYSGAVYFIKVPNIQPTEVSVKINEALPGV